MNVVAVGTFPSFSSYSEEFLGDYEELFFCNCI